MSDQPVTGGPGERWEERVRLLARAFPYPPTPPELVERLRRPAGPGRQAAAPFARTRLAWALAALAVIVAALLAVPQVRAGLIEFLQVGVIRIFLVAPTPTVTAPPAGASGESALSTATPSLAPPTPTLLPSLLNLAGETTLEDARRIAPFTIRLPTYPPDLGEPDHVFLQDLDGTAVVLVWLDREKSDRVRLSLHYLTSPNIGFKGEKGQPEIILTTQVNGQDALWTEGPYILQLRNGNFDMRRLIEGHVLIWTEGDITLRLETDLSLEEAIRIAESLK